MKLLLGKPSVAALLASTRAANVLSASAALQLQRAANADCMARASAPARSLDATYLRHEPRLAQIPLHKGGPRKRAALWTAARAPNILSSPHLVWGACTPIVRAQLLDRRSLTHLLQVLTPQQFAFIRSNVFVPPQLQALHARLRAASPEPATVTPLGCAVSALVRGGRTDKLAYLFPYFHLLAGSHQPTCGGTWFGVENARDVRILARMAAALHPTAEPYCQPRLASGPTSSRPQLWRAQASPAA